MSAYNDEDRHAWLRGKMCDYLIENKDELAWVVNLYTSPKKYAKEMRKLEKWGGTSDVVLCSKFIGRPIIFVNPNDTAITYKPGDSDYEVSLRRARDYLHILKQTKYILKL